MATDSEIKALAEAIVKHLQWQQRRIEAREQLRIDRMTRRRQKRGDREHREQRTAA